MKKSYDKFSIVQFILNLIPVLKWLPKYSIKNNLPGDISAGITVAVMHIPQGKFYIEPFYVLTNLQTSQKIFHIMILGMAYGLLAGVTPSSGLYMAFFPTLVYFVFGTSRHISVGTLSVISLMTLKLVQTYATPSDVIAAINSNKTGDIATESTLTADEYFTPMQVVTAAAFMCGVHQVSLFREF